MFERTLFAVAAVASVFLVLSSALLSIKHQRPIPKRKIDLLRWLIIVLVGLYLVSRYGLEGWRVAWFGR